MSNDGQIQISNEAVIAELGNRVAAMAIENAKLSAAVQVLQERNEFLEKERASIVN
jgi:hypothetical protein